MKHDRIVLLDRYIRIPTLSRRVTPELTEQVRSLWAEQGLALRPLLPPDGSGPAYLYGEIAGPPGAPVLLLYGHYDVQPTGDVSRWVWEGVPCDPFTPTYFLDGRQTRPEQVAEGALDRLLVVARGGSDNKGQHTANILGALDAARAGTLRWTVKVLLDGEEEHGSPHLTAVAEAHRELLRADILVGSDGPKQGNRPTLVMGVRGLLLADIVAENGAAVSLHSGNYGNIVPNPALPLARLIADMQDRIHAYAEGHDQFRHQAAATFAEWADQAVWKPFLWPSTNINHLLSDGASEELTRTIIPRAVHARVDVRLTPDTPPGPIRALIERTVADHAAETEGVTFSLRTGDDLPASYTPPDHPAFDWLLRLMAEDGEEPVAMPTLGGTLPAFVFTDVLGLPSFWLPAANENNRQHDINEHYIFKHYFQQAALYQRIVSSLP